MQILSVERSCSALQNPRICILDISVDLWYSVSVNKNISQKWRHRFPQRWFVGGLWLTTVLTIYSFGLRGNSACKSIRKHRFRTRKLRKAVKITQKIGIGFFGSTMPQVRILSLRSDRITNLSSRRSGSSCAEKISVAKLLAAWSNFSCPSLRPNLTNSNIQNSKRIVNGLVRFFCPDWLMATRLYGLDYL